MLAVRTDRPLRFAFNHTSSSFPSFPSTPPRRVRQEGKDHRCSQKRMRTPTLALASNRRLPHDLRAATTTLASRDLSPSSPSWSPSRRRTPFSSRTYAMLPSAAAAAASGPGSSPFSPPATSPPALEAMTVAQPAAPASVWPYRYVATPSALTYVLDAIRALPEPRADDVLKQRHIFFDSEGYELGTTVGKLSVVQLGLTSPTASRGVDVFLIDILALSAPDVSPSVLRGLWDVLEDGERVVKIGWDLKQDWAELFRKCRPLSPLRANPLAERRVPCAVPRRLPRCRSLRRAGSSGR
jgi:hypothetical protein